MHSLKWQWSVSGWQEFPGLSLASLQHMKVWNLPSLFEDSIRSDRWPTRVVVGGTSSVKHVYYMKNNIVFITKSSSHIEYFLNMYTMNHKWPFIIFLRVHKLFHLKEKFLIATLKGLSKLIWSPFRSSTLTPSERVMMRQDRNRVESYYIKCDVLVSLQLWPVITLPTFIRKRKLIWKSKYLQLICSNMQLYKFNK